MIKGGFVAYFYGTASALISQWVVRFLMRFILKCDYFFTILGDEPSEDCEKCCKAAALPVLFQIDGSTFFNNNRQDQPCAR
ncbi:hypothetical protein VU05_00935 [Desulfobulbus sp. F1]|nr:hypothetical protein [Desulfobulbus sp. F1]